MIEIDNRLINVFKDISNFKGIMVYAPKEGYLELDLAKRKHPEILESAEGENATMFPYLFVKGLEEGWLKVEVDETNPNNKLNYINKLLSSYGEKEDGK